MPRYRARADDDIRVMRACHIIVLCDIFIAGSGGAGASVIAEDERASSCGGARHRRVRSMLCYGARRRYVMMRFVAPVAMMRVTMRQCYFTSVRDELI